MKISGIGFVYMITSPTGRIYVGSTVDIEERWNIYRLYHCKDQPKLYNSLKKYGYEAHIKEIVWAGELCDMYKYETMIGFGFNVLEPENLTLALPPNGSSYSFISEETKKKLSIANKGRKPTDECRRKSIEASMGNKFRLNKFHSVEVRNKISIGTKNSSSFQESMKNKRISILQLDLQGNFIREWTCCLEAAETLKISKGNITSCCKGTRNQTGGFKWKYKT